MEYNLTFTSAGAVDPRDGTPLAVEGGAPALVTVTRDGPTNTSLTVFLGNGDPSETRVPSSVVIPAGQTSTTFEIPAFDDRERDGSVQVKVIASAPGGYGTTTFNMTVADNETQDTVVQQVYLGNFDPTDPIKNNAASENADLLLGFYDNFTVQSVDYGVIPNEPIRPGSFFGTNPDAFVLDSSGGSNRVSQMDYTIDGVFTQSRVNDTMRFRADFTMEDGTRFIGVDVAVYQSDDGDVFLQTYVFPDKTVIDDKIFPDGTVVSGAGKGGELLTQPIASIELTQIASRVEDGQVLIGFPASVVTPPDPIDAVDDFITVFESETSGDLETLVSGDDSVLDNDDNQGADVVAVDGVIANVGQFVDLAGGGRVAINADGTVDFDADGDFEALNDGESDQVTVDYTIGTLVTTNAAPIQLEIENLNLSGFNAFDFISNASGSATLTFSTGASATLNSFSGASGVYDITYSIQDLAGGVSTFNVLVNGTLVDMFVTDQDTDGSSWVTGTFSDFVAEDVFLNTGDQVTLELTSRSGSELGVIDQVSFAPQTGGTATIEDADSATVTITVLGEDDGATLSGRVTTEAPGTQSLTYIIDHSFDMYRRTASTQVEDANGDGQLRVVDVVLNRIVEETAGLDAAQTVNFILVGDEEVRGAQTLTAGDIQAAAQANDLASLFGAVFAQPDGTEVSTQFDFRAVNINLALQEARTYITDTTLGFDAVTGADQDNIVFITASDGTVGIDPVTGASLALDDFTAIRDELLDAAGIDAEIDVVSVNTGIRLDEIDAGFDFSPVVIDPSNMFDPLLLVELDSDGVVNNVDGTDAFGLAELTENTTLVDTGEVLSVFAGGQEFTVASGALVDTNPAAEVFEFELAGIENLDPAQIFLGVDRDGDGVQDLPAAQVPAASIIETAPDTFEFDFTLEPADAVFGG